MQLLKPKVVYGLLYIFGLSLVLLSAHPGITQVAEQPAHKERLKAAILEKYDLNRNGVLDPEEREAWQKDRDALLQQLRDKMAAQRAAILQQYDTNHNGVLDPDEQEALQPDRKAKLEQLRAKILEKYDVNKNGILDPEEREALEKDRARLQALHEKMQARRGTLSLEERTQRQTAGREAVKQLKAQILEHFDTNKNGILDPDEKETMRALLRSKQRIPTGQ